VADLTVPLARAPVSGRFEVPPSKSIHQRALALAALSGAETEIVAPGRLPGDVVVLARALSAMAGREVPAVGGVPGSWGEEGLGSHRRSLRLDLAANGTGARLSIALAALRPAGARTLVTGTPRLRARPQRPLLAALERLGANAHRKSTGAVRVVARPLSTRPVAIDATLSSQHASALLLVAPRIGGLDLRLVGPPVSRAYLALTVESLEDFGIAVHADAERIVVEPGAPRAARVVVVEPDASSAAVWWAAAAISGGDVVVAGLPASTSQPDAALLPVLERMGARVGRTEAGEARVRGPRCRLLGAGDVDLRDAPDLAPLVAALAAGAEGETRVVGAPHLAHKESDRIATCVAAVRAVGGDASEAEGGFVVHGRPLRGGRVRVAGDHRLALAFGVLGLAAEGVVLAGAEAVEKSWPGFAGDLHAAAADGSGR